MARQWCANWVSGVALATALAVPALAEDRRAVVIAGSETDRSQAVAMSETLLGLGFDVERLEAPTDAELQNAAAALDANDGPTVVYIRGLVYELDAFVSGDGPAPRFVFLDACESDTPEWPENVYAVVPNTCDVDLSELLLGQITVPGLATDQWVFGDDIGISSTLEVPFVFRTPSSDVRLSAEDYAMLDTLSDAARDQMIALWRKAGIAVDAETTGSATPDVVVETVRVAPVSPVVPTAVVTPVAPRLTSATGPVQDSVSVVARPLVATPAVSAPQDGLPQPSILVGYVIENLPDAPLVPDEPLSGAGFGSDDVAAREALRDQDAAVFDGLVEAGAFDPPEGQVARALQVELARINCYTSGIDGAWGPGSQRALLAFYQEVGAVPPGTEADLEAFRAVIARDDIRCPDPVPVAQPVAAARPAPAPAAPQSTRIAPVAQPAPAPAPTPAAPAQPARRSISQTSGTGVFR